MDYFKHSISVRAEVKTLLEIMLIQEPVVVFKSFNRIKSIEKLVEEVIHKNTRASFWSNSLTMLLVLGSHASKIVLVLSQLDYLKVVKL